jgi:phosphoribosylanthranilate isomerase
MGRTRIKICCIQSHEEARLAIAAGADALGLVAAMPSGPGVIPEPLIHDLAVHTPPPVATFLLTSHTSAQDIVDQHRRCRTSTIQFCDRIAAADYSRLRELLPGTRLVQVVHVEGPEAVEEARRVAPHVDALLLDSGRPSLRVRELGGTGRMHDWSVSRAVREAVEVPVFLAGGLRPDNVAAAVAAVHPFAVDVCSGLRPAGGLDADRLHAFVAAVRAAS